jgi:hypothetical protein
MSVESSTLGALTPAQIAELEGMLTNFVTKAGGGGDENLPLVVDMAIARHGSHTSEEAARAAESAG